MQSRTSGMYIGMFTEAIQVWCKFAVGTELVKCSRCTIKQVQDAFPRARNLKYLKTCDACTLKVSRSRQKKCDEHTPEMSLGEESSSSTSTLMRKGPKPWAAELCTQLTWEEFLGLVGSHKSLAVAFELDAEIKLGDFPHCSWTSDSDTGEIAKAIADEVWKAAGYWFMWASDK